ncbi:MULTISPECIES: hypothetical protein [Xanthomonas]|uniref:Uncharacterized protein n=1 Tax=Xanthomonas arboricola pv. corylina TaxID=487821 RepID=A0A8D6VFM7_9XANT|nr:MULTISPECIES: hypothetical protein [Xanthomonas]PPU45513.1 hypothetical protein XarbCFBP7697_06670 [Xanthomonas arboricola]WIX26099.1 hypothetical protein PUV44_04970 [Xanthomonas arboricola pv. corylina]CAE6738092.1 hypothetical protein XAC301_13630 [Xanthomonas arboricola pv. corylina]CAE6738114.1 hypothetical protein XAC301_13630 [Xanthomonas arboricola pv. corylina]CAE6813080.1 hypothetical protein CFBP1159_31690 [Xanthomonas arboricola pv. corylina]
MTQREISHPEPLPACRAGHAGRHIVDSRRLQAGGGHVIECRCGRTKKHSAFDQALAEWKRMHRIRVPRQTAPADSNVVQLGLRLRGGTGQ